MSCFCFHFHSSFIFQNHNKMAMKVTSQSITLVNGKIMPLIGLGTYQMKGYDLLYKAIDAALASGYRSFDTASVYRNESDIGQIFKVLLPKYELSRKDIFITSKLAPSEQGKGKAKSACLGSIDRLGCDYLDLYLIHWPGTQKLQPQDSKHKTYRQETWMDMEDAVKEGKCKSIGVSNYLPSHLEDLFSYATVKPAVLQTEYHPHLIQRSVKKLCDDHGIHLQAYSSLGTSAADNKLLSDPCVKEIADTVGKTPAQVLLRWAVQQNIGVLPKSTDPNHIAENMDIFSFSLNENHLKALDNLDNQVHYCWNPSQIA